MLKTLLAYQTKDKTIPLLKKEETEYVVYNLIPDRFITKGKMIEEILVCFSALRQPPLKVENKSLVYKPLYPIYYEILYQNNFVSFNYVIPKIYEKIIVNKINSVFKTATFRKIDDYFDFEKYCAFNQKKHFMFSLNVDYRENGLIENFINMISNVQDKLLFQIGIVPMGENWKTNWMNAYKKHKNDDSLERSNDMIGLALDKTFNAAEGLMKVFDMVVGVDSPKQEKEDNFLMNSLAYNKNKRMTMKKVSYDGYNVQLRLYSNNNLYYYSKLFDGLLKVIDADQELVPKRVKKCDGRSFDFQFQKDIFSTKELSMFMQLPNRRMQIEYKKQMKSIETRQVETPKKLLDSKGIPIGIYEYKGEKKKIFFPSDKDNANYSLLLTGMQRTGKSSMIANYVIESTLRGHSNFLFDTIKGCELSDQIRDYMPQSHYNKLIVLDFENIDYTIPLSWNETNIDTGSKRHKLLKASMLAGSFESFLDTCNINLENERLRPKMKRYLSSACKLVLQNDDSTIYDIILCLTDINKRHEFIKKSGLDKDSKTVQDMFMLDMNNKTNYNEIKGIIDRISVLMNDYYMELFLSVPANKKINFKQWTNDGQCVLIKLPEESFSPVSINSLVTFLFTKIWLSILDRGKTKTNTPVHIIGDEIHKFSEVTKLLYGWIREGAKYQTNFVLSAHTLKDLKTLLPVFRASGAHYMLFKSSPLNYKLLENELFPYTVEELSALKEFHSMNIINYNRNYTVFQTEAIKPPDKRLKYYNRKNLDLEHSKIYGVPNFE